jgi:hypothetical protein
MADPDPPPPVVERDEADDSMMLVGMPYGFPLSLPFGLLLFDNIAIGIAFAPLLSLAIGWWILEQRKESATVDPDDEAQAEP